MLNSKKITFFLAIACSMVLFFLLIFFKMGDYDIQVERTISFERYPPLLEAIESDASLKKIRTILEKDPTIIKELQDPKSDFPVDPLAEAAFKGRKDIIVLLLEYGANPELTIESLKKDIGEDEVVNLIRECYQERSKRSETPEGSSK